MVDLGYLRHILVVGECLNADEEILGCGFAAPRGSLALGKSRFAKGRSGLAVSTSQMA